MKIIADIGTVNIVTEEGITYGNVRNMHKTGHGLQLSEKLEPNENDSCFFCRWNKVDSDCSQLAICKNFKRNDLDRIIDGMDCLPLDIVAARDIGKE